MTRTRIVAAAPPPEIHTPLLPSRPSAVGGKHPSLLVMNGIDAGRVVPLDKDAIVVGRDPSCDVCIDDPALSRLHARIGRGPHGDCYVEDLGSTNGTYLRERRVTIAPLASGDSVQLGATLLVRYEETDDATLELREQLYQSSVRDALTRVFNHRHFVERLAVEVAHVRRTDTGLSVLMIDIDEFKRFNDTFGHLPGDRALAAVAARIAHVVRVGDVVGRWGGEEFVVLAREARLEQAAELAERVRRAIAMLGLSVAGALVSITVSIGVASLDEIDPADDPSVLVALADERMYAAKLAGRNRICDGRNGGVQ